MLVKYIYNLCLCQFIFLAKVIHIDTLKTCKNKAFVFKLCKVTAQSSKSQNQVFDKHKPGADFTKGLKPRRRLIFKTLGLNFVNRMLSPCYPQIKCVK